MDFPWNNGNTCNIHPVAPACKSTIHHGIDGPVSSIYQIKIVIGHSKVFTL